MRAPPKRLQWVKYDLGANLLALTNVSPAAELAHHRLSLCYWQSGEWPATLRGNAAGLCRVAEDQWPGVLEELAVLGWRERSGRLWHREVRRVRAEAVEAVKQCRQAGQHGAQRRWNKAPAGREPSGPDTPPNGDPIATPLATPLATPMQIKSKSKSENMKEIERALNEAERLTLSVSAHEKSPGAEKDFLGDVKAALEAWGPERAEAELTNWGGWWRKRFRESPDKARRVLAEIRSMVREGRILSNPGAAAMDLWKRLP